MLRPCVGVGFVTLGLCQVNEKRAIEYIHIYICIYIHIYICIYIYIHTHISSQRNTTFY
jgi:hypothetical protein